MMLMKLCPNLDNQDGLETVLEVPIPEEMYTKMGSNAILRWQNLCNFMKAQSAFCNSSYLQASSDNEFLTLLKIVGTPLVPFRVDLENYMHSNPIQDSSIEASTAKYIIQQFVAATGGHLALRSIRNMYAVGQVQMQGSETLQGNSSVQTRVNCEFGGFVLLQKNPDLWYLELVVSGFKVSAGCDGKVAWNQSSSQPGHAHRGPPRPLRRFSQGLDPRCTASLFINAVCIGEQVIDNEDCFILMLETDSKALKAQSSSQAEIIHHTVRGYFSQRTGLLTKFEDKKLVRMKTYRWKRRVLGDQRGIPDPRLQIRRWDQHSAWRKHHYDALPVREVPQAQAEDRRNLDDRRGTQPNCFQLQFIKQAYSFSSMMTVFWEINKYAWNHGVRKGRLQKKQQAKLRHGRWKLIFDIDGPWIVNDELSAFCL
ncbi:hypothetical protein GOBAR_DD17540 [Gossypium barbadense]|nr:hypothetical protein GOBAR_DD17540 [Gossypium barbadense]